MMNRFRKLPTILAFAILAALFIEVLAEVNPYDKYRNLTHSNKGYLSEDDELKLGAQVHQELLKQIHLIQDPATDEYINTLGQQLASVSGRPNIPWHFYVIEDKSINAFATLGGRVYVHTGLLAATTSEAQLASVLGHEIGHIVGRHGLENIKRQQRYGALAGIAEIGGAILGGQAGANLGGAAGNLLAGGYLMKHSRDAEREADFLGLYNIKKSGYNTGGMIEIFETLEKVSATSPGAMGSIMASHPPPAERLANTRLEINQHLLGSDQTGRSDTEEFDQFKANFKNGGSSITPNPPHQRRNRDSNNGDNNKSNGNNGNNN